MQWERQCPPMGGAMLTTGVRAESFAFVAESLGLELESDLLDAVKMYVPEMLKMFASRSRRASARASMAAEAEKEFVA